MTIGDPQRGVLCNVKVHVVAAAPIENAICFTCAFSCVFTVVRRRRDANAVEICMPGLCHIIFCIPATVSHHVCDFTSVIIIDLFACTYKLLYIYATIDAVKMGCSIIDRAISATSLVRYNQVWPVYISPVSLCCSKTVIVNVNTPLLFCAEIRTLCDAGYLVRKLIDRLNEVAGLIGPIYTFGRVDDALNVVLSASVILANKVPRHCCAHDRPFK